MTDVPNIQYLLINRWGDHLHPDIQRKAKPPYRWIKLETENLDALGDLTLREYGAYCRLLGIAALTNNQTVFNLAWIKRRTGITRKDIEKLQKRGLVSICSETGEQEESEENQRNVPNTASVNSADQQNPAALEGRGRDKSRSDLTGIEGAELPFPGIDKSISFTPPRDAQRKNGHDPRSFDELKTAVLPIARKLNSQDADEIHLLARQSLRMSQKQVRAAVKQLVEDGEL